MKKSYCEGENTPAYPFVSLLFWTYSFLSWYLIGNTVLELISNILSLEIMEVEVINQKLSRDYGTRSSPVVQERVTVVLEGSGVQVINLFPWQDIPSRVGILTAENRDE